MLYHSYASLRVGTPQFFDKLEKMIEKDCVRKSYTQQVYEVLNLIQAMALRSCRNQTIWEVYLKDLQSGM